MGAKFDNIDMWVSGFAGELNPDGIPVAITANVSSFGLGYSMGNGVRLDASRSNLGIGLGGPGINLGLTELGLGYDNGQFFGRVSYANVDQPILGIDALYGLHVGYQMSDRAEISLSAHKVEISGGPSIDPLLILSGSYNGGAWGVDIEAAKINLLGTSVSLTSLGGHYDFSPAMSAYGSYSMAELDGTSADLIRVGASYSMNERYSLFADYTQASIEGSADDLTGFRIGASMDLGNKPASQQTTVDRLGGVLSRWPFSISEVAKEKQSARPSWAGRIHF